MRTRPLVALFATAVLATAALPARAVQWAVSIDIAPPAPLVVEVPPPRAGYLWVPGYWNWEGQRHVWRQGVWMRERRGYAYAQPHWVQQGPHWKLERGRWARGGEPGNHGNEGHGKDKGKH